MIFNIFSNFCSKVFHVRSVTQGDVIRAEAKDIPRIFQVQLHEILMFEHLKMPTNEKFFLYYILSNIFYNPLKDFVRRRG